MISNSNSFGLRITGANGTVVQGNYFGTDPAGAAQAPNAVDIKVGSQSVSDLAVGTRIGGFLSVGEQASAECDGPCNVISGASTMIDLDGTSPHTEAANFTEIRGNYIGVNHDASAALGSTNAIGVNVGDADETSIGFSDSSGTNVITGMTETAIQVFDGADNLNAANNLIGTSPTGTASLSPPPIGFDVIGVTGPESGTAPPRVASNTISATSRGIYDELRNGAIYASNSIGVGPGNAALTIGSGIQLRGSEDATVDSNTIGNATDTGAIALNGAQGSEIVGNTIGPDPSLANAQWGIWVQAFNGVLPTTGTSIGGDDAGAENVISNSADGAIGIQGGVNDANQVLRNTGTGNDGLFIDLGADGPGATTGVNEDIQPPAIAAATPSAVSGTGQPGATVRLFSKASSAPGEVASFAGQATVAGDGTWSIAPGSGGGFVGATQTLASDGTSELAIHAVGPDTEPPGGGGGGADVTAPETTITKHPKKKGEAQGEVQVRVLRGRLELRVQARQEALQAVQLAVQEGQADQAQVPRPGDRRGRQHGRVPAKFKFKVKPKS